MNATHLALLLIYPAIHMSRWVGPGRIAIAVLPPLSAPCLSLVLGSVLPPSPPLFSSAEHEPRRIQAL